MSLYPVPALALHSQLITFVELLEKFLYTFIIVMTQHAILKKN